MSTLKKAGVGHLKWMAVSHYDQDHLGNVVPIGDAVPTDVVYDRGGAPAKDPKTGRYPKTYRDYIDWVDKPGHPQRQSLQAIGARFFLCSGPQRVTFTVVSVGTSGSAAGGVKVSGENDKGLCLKVTYRDFDLATCGDISGGTEGTGEHDLSSVGGIECFSGETKSGGVDVESAVAQLLGRVEFAKVDHHGSPSSSNPYFVSTLRPRASVIVGDVAQYKHPSCVVVEEWEQQGHSHVYVTTNPDRSPKDGEVIVTTSGEQRFTVTTTASGRSDTYPMDEQSRPSGRKIVAWIAISVLLAFLGVVGFILVIWSRRRHRAHDPESAELPAEPSATSVRDSVEEGKPKTGIGVAMSGGGHRATLFGLGVLLYLADVRRNREVVTISSVSGGSLTNAFVGLECDYPAVDSITFRAVARRLASQIAKKGTLFAWPGTWFYLTGLVVFGLATFLVWLLPWHWLARLAVFIAAVTVWEIAFLRQRGVICGRAYAATLFRRDGSPAKLAAIHRPAIDHVVCATHLHAGEHMYFSGGFVYAYRFGWGRPGDIPLHVAVQASTAVPGVFPPRWIRSGRFGFEQPAKVPARIALADGGVYDNMADQWLSGSSRRAPLPSKVKTPNLFVIANASASMGMEPVGLMRLPLVGEIAALKRSESIMYDNSASIRKRDLIDRFDAAAADGDCARFGEPGALLDIRSDPFLAATLFRDQESLWPERAARSKEALKKKPADWISDAKWASGMPTNLSRWSVGDSARLLRHAYALAAINLHVFLDFGLVDIPSLEEFEALCR